MAPSVMSYIEMVLIEEKQSVKVLDLCEGVLETAHPFSVTNTFNDIR